MTFITCARRLFLRNTKSHFSTCHSTATILPPLPLPRVIIVVSAHRRCARAGALTSPLCHLLRCAVHHARHGHHDSEAGERSCETLLQCRRSLPCGFVERQHVSFAQGASARANEDVRAGRSPSLVSVAAPGASMYVSAFPAYTPLPPTMDKECQRAARIGRVRERVQRVHQSEAGSVARQTAPNRENSKDPVDHDHTRAGRVPPDCADQPHVHASRC